MQHKIIWNKNDDNCSDILLTINLPTDFLIIIIEYFKIFYGNASGPHK